MEVFKISARSECGTYFMSYLQSVTVIAIDEKDARERVKSWLKEKEDRFVRPEPQWVVECLGNCEPGVIDDHYDSDY